jgi:quercetin dioxygenase-like cupin family protein
VSTADAAIADPRVDAAEGHHDGVHGAEADRSPTVPYVVRRGGSRLADALVDIKAARADTAGAVTVSEFALPAWAQGPVRHVHDVVDEALYVLTGRLDLELGAERLFAEAGDFVWMPHGIPHGFSCAGDEEVRALALALPGGLEDLFREQAAYLAGARDGVDPAQMDAIGRRHGARPVGPPLEPRRPEPLGAD